MKNIIICLLSLILAGAIILGGCAAPTSTPSTSPTPATAAKPHIKIGHIRSLTGPLAITNTAMVQGFDLAIEQANYEAAGRKIDVILEDDANKPELALDKARKLVEQDKVDMVVGPTMTNLQIAIASYMDPVGIPNINTNPSPYVIIAAKRKWTIQLSGCMQRIPSCSGRYAYEQGGIKTVTSLGEDSAGGHGYIGSFESGFKHAGGEVIQEQWTPLNCADYAPYLAAAKPADGFLAWIAGNDSVKFLNQYYEFGMWDKMPIVPAYQGAIIESFILAQLQPKAAEACLGVTTAVLYSPLLDNPVNKKFVEAFRSKYNTYPDMANVTGYDSALVILATLEATKGDTTPQVFMDTMLASTTAGASGTIRFDKEKKSAITDISISKLQKVGNEYVFSQPLFTYKDVPPEGF